MEEWREGGRDGGREGGREGERESEEGGRVKGREGKGEEREGGRGREREYIHVYTQNAFLREYRGCLDIAMTTSRILTLGSLPFYKNITTQHIYMYSHGIAQHQHV